MRPVVPVGVVDPAVRNVKMFWSLKTPRYMSTIAVHSHLLFMCCDAHRVWQMNS